MDAVLLLAAAVILGAVQGLTEFLPVSSTAHLVIIPRLLNWSHSLLNSLAFDVALHLGTLAAVTVVFGREWLGLVRSLGRPRTRKGRMGWGLIVATLPALAAGALFESRVSTTLRGPFSVAAWLAIGAVALFVADRLGRGRKGTAESPGYGGAFVIGCAQALAILPGLSRSGATMTAALFLGLSRREAARYSFLLSAPVIAAACVWEARRLVSFPASELLPVLAGVAVAAAVGAAAIRWMMAFVARAGFTPFVVYRLVLAAAIAAWSR